MTVAARMRKYRRKLALVRALDRARDHGVDVLAVVDAWREGVTPIGVTDTATADLFEHHAGPREGEQ